MGSHWCWCLGSKHSHRCLVERVNGGFGTVKEAESDEEREEEEEKGEEEERGFKSFNGGERTS